MEQMNRLERYRRLKENHPDAVVLFRSRDFYTSIEEDADELGETLGLPIIGRKCGFFSEYLDTYLPRLIRANKRIIITEDEQNR